MHQIFPKKVTERWKLQLSEEKKWLLIVGGVPQILCCQEEVIRFLERRRLTIESPFDIRG
ncbi:hypothetical protein FACHB389_22125 [Nostoc calcicola FACHB-389]|nr:hypothetical protein FACHB389_22125 [Nostoc calcicola FACHB-389]